MIVSHHCQFIYVRTIKTASSSLEMALAKLCGPSDIITPLDTTRVELGSRRGYPGPQHTDLPLVAWTKGNYYMKLRGRAPEYYNHMPVAKSGARGGSEGVDAVFQVHC